MKFIDRADEMETLDKEYQKKGSSFVVIYGRRRVGKTTLLRKFCEGKKSVFFLATEETENMNRQAFQYTVAEDLGEDLLKNVSASRWEPIFDVIAQHARYERLVLVIDEFQYLGKANAAFPSILMRIWDQKLQDTNIMLVLCGSLIRMMKSQVLNYNSPLYGRRTAQIRMKQIPFRYYHEFMPDLPEDDLIQRYAITGGVPKYIELFSNQQNIYSAIRQNILNPNMFLYEEPEFLLQKEVSEIGSYFSLLKVIAEGRAKLSAMATALEVKQNSLSSYLNTLIELDLIEREVPVTEENSAKSKMGRYRIKDNFISFWFRFVYPYRAMIEAGHIDYVLDKIKAHFIENHVAYVYEDVCREKMWDYLQKPLVFNRVGRWWGKKEIDILAYDSTGTTMIFGECKYSRHPKGMDVLIDLKEKAGYVPWKKNERKENYILFSRSGYSEALKQYAKEHEDVILA